MYLEDVIEKTLEEYAAADLTNITTRLEIASTVKHRLKEKLLASMKPKLQLIAEEMEHAAESLEQAVKIYSRKRFLEHMN